MSLALFLKSTSALAVDLYVDCEAGSNGDALTADLLNSMTHGSGVTWSLTDTDNSLTVSTSGEGALPGSVSAGGSTYTDNGTRGIAVNHTSGGTHQFVATLAAGYGVFAFGTFITFGIPPGLWNNFDYFSIYPNPQFLAGNLRSEGVGDPLLFRSESDVGGASWGPNIEVEQNKRYWVTAVYDATTTDTGTIKVYDPDDWSLVGTSPVALTHGTAVDIVRMGILNSSAEANAVTSYFDDIVMRWTAPITELMPTGI